MKPLEIDDYDRLWFIWYDLGFIAQHENDDRMVDFFRVQRYEATRMKWLLHARAMKHPRMERYQP